MATPKTRQAFTPQERDNVQRLLALKVTQMMGRKLEEADWVDVYCQAKGIPAAKWSNLNIDVVHGHIGIEQKALCYRKSNIEDAIGTRFMHPAATRSIRVNTDLSAEDAKNDVLEQYASNIADHRRKIAAVSDAPDAAELRTGWLLWQDTLRQFLYFEEELLEPIADEYTAEWRESGSEGRTRKPSRNLWIYEKSSGDKRYSVTTSAGVKIQPYFLVPPSDPNVHVFTVIGETIDTGTVRMWLTSKTARALVAAAGGSEVDAVSELVSKSLDSLPLDTADAEELVDKVSPVAVSAEVYESLLERTSASSDEERIAALLDALGPV